MGDLKQFRWRTSAGDELLPQDMGTTHIYNTVVMIWNHNAPEEFKFHPYKHYRFSSFYTTEYMRDAIVALLMELAFRIDLQGYQYNTIMRMMSFFQQRFDYEFPSRKEIQHLKSIAN